MSYALIADFKKRFVADEVAQLSQGDDAAIQVVLDTASREIDGYIGSRYDVPVFTVSSDLRDFCLIMARYWLVSRVGQQNMKESVIREDYQHVLQRLNDIAENKRDLLNVPLKLIKPDDGVLLMESSARLFGRGQRG